MTEYVATDPSAAPPLAEPFVEPWASWGRRVLATLLDAGLQLPFAVVIAMLNIAALDPQAGPVTRLVGALMALGVWIASLVFAFWNSVIRQGRKGASLGKQACGILVLSLTNARPIGAGSTFIRGICHLADYASLGLGYLWPLWDARRQTFADKMANTGVLYLPDVRF